MSTDNLITDTELALLESCRSNQAWSDACDTIKTNHGGGYPSDWWAKVKLTGMMDRILARFGQSSEIRFHAF